MARRGAEPQADTSAWWNWRWAIFHSGSRSGCSGSRCSIRFNLCSVEMTAISQSSSPRSIARRINSTSISTRASVTSTRSWRLTGATRNPRCSCASTRPSAVSAVSASRSVVKLTPNRSRRTSNRSGSPGARPQAMISSRSRWVMSAATVLPNSLRGRMALSDIGSFIESIGSTCRANEHLAIIFVNDIIFENMGGDEIMRAVLVRQPGGPDALELVERPVPVPGPGHVQIRAEAFGVGQPDVLIRRGVYKWMPPLPANPGNDVAGRIAALGSGVEGFAIGQKVLLSARDLPQRGGCYADYVVAPADAIHVLPDNVDLQAAVCLSNYQVAYALLNECRHPRAPASVLVIGAAGGVGTALVQLAKLAQMNVIGTVSNEEKAAFARGNGADHVIYYRREDVVARTRELTNGEGVGLVLDHVCGPEFTGYLGALGKWGTLLSYNAFAGLPEENLMAAMRDHLDICPAIRCFSFHIYDHDRDGRRALMRNVIDALSRNAIKPAISAVLKLDEVRQAHTLLEQGSALGKIIMTP